MAAKGSSVILSIFARIFLIVSYALCLLTFVFAAIIFLTPNYHGNMYDVGYWSFGENQNILTDKPTALSGAGIAVMVLWAISLIISIVTVVALKKSKYTIGKNNKVTRVFIPINIGILIVVILGLISQPNLIHISSSGYSLILADWVVTKGDTAAVLTNNANLDLSVKYNVVYWVLLGITAFIALGIVFDIIGFVFRIFFSRTKDKANA